jgi:hypothetical protein
MGHWDAGEAFYNYGEATRYASQLTSGGRNRQPATYPQYSM